MNLSDNKSIVNCVADRLGDFKWTLDSCRCGYSFDRLSASEQLEMHSRAVLLLNSLEEHLLEQDEKIIVVPAKSDITFDSVDWNDVPEMWQYMARDRDGDVWFFRDEPEKMIDFWTLNNGKDNSVHVHYVTDSYKQGSMEWDNSLVKRPSDFAKVT